MFNMWSTRPDGSDQQYFLLGNGRRIRKMAFATYGARLSSQTTSLFMLTDAGNLLKWDVLNPRASFINTLATGVSDFAIRNESSGFLNAFASIYAIQNRKQLLSINA